MQKIQTLNENDLSKNYLLPLLTNMGFHNVEFYGGSNELGKDIVAWKKDDFGELRVTLIQVKHFKFTNNFSNKKSFTTIVNQLTTSLKKSIIYKDKRFYLPDQVCLFSSFPIDTKTLETRFGEYPDLVDRKIRIVDGYKLSELLIEHLPDSIYQLLGHDVEISTKLLKGLNNEVLLKALGYSKKKEIKNIFTDIDFSIGKRTTELFFNADFDPYCEILSLSKEDFDVFKNACHDVKDEFSLDFLNISLEEAETNQVIFERRQIQKIRTSLKNEIRPEETIEVQPLAIQPEGPVEIQLFSVIRIGIDGSKIADQLVSKRSWIEKTVKIYNKKRPTRVQLKRFIEKCKAIIDASTVFFRYKSFYCIGYKQEKVFRNNFDSTRFNMPIQLVYDTGLNLIVLGEAGAGKTTSLQIYALSNESETLKLFIPISLPNLISTADKKTKEYNLDELVAKYLQAKGVNITYQQFVLNLQTKDTVLLLDALDEAIKENPWLPTAIKSLANKYSKHLQTVVTSRASGSYIREIPFFAVTMLPFTNEQRNKFIEKWFDDGDNLIVEKIKVHLRDNPNLAEIINTPLLTTILCVLAKNEIQLPNTELKLYNDRMKLLCGYYDRVKNIDVRMTSTPQMLEWVAQRLAFYLHQNSKRDEDKKILLEIAVKETLQVVSRKEAEVAIEELIDPCNILVPMTDEGKFGFGHLRYQEYLAAKELMENRGIQVLPLLKQSWWQGTLRLFALLNHDLKWLVEEFGRSEAKTTLREPLINMINLRPSAEKTQLISLLNGYYERFLAEESEDDPTYYG